MNPVRLIVRTYYERLHERMEADRERLIDCIDVLLPAEIARQKFGPLRGDQVEAYREACHAFIDERLETYNPVGIQYTFDRGASSQAAELELQLDWYDSRREFQTLVTAARALAGETDTPDERLTELADELIRQVGAFPDGSIIAGYLAKPALQKLPDYLVASAIEQVICGRKPERR
ncbi:MAG: hypothetical protein JSW27_17080 [Phycisphaerales bacterium]|nr:MAG: hypothetical protein JSW27_17080 [Phycisphaerales bacterium]